MTRTIGLLGGMSWVSTVHYYEGLNRLHASRLGGEHCAPLLMWQTDFATIAELQRAGDWHRAGEILADGTRRLVAAGAELVAICANTMHLVLDQVEEAAGDVPVVSILDAVADECRARGVHRLGLVGTAYTMESPALYPPRLARDGVEMLVPDEADRAEIQRITYEELIRDAVGDESRATFARIGGDLAARGAEAVVLACTEHAMLLADGDLPVPVLDSTEIHIGAIARAAGA